MGKEKVEINSFMKSIVCQGRQLHLVGNITDSFQHTVWTLIRLEQSDLDPHYLLQRPFKRTSKPYTADNICIIINSYKIIDGRESTHSLILVRSIAVNELVYSKYNVPLCNKIHFSAL